MTVHRVLPAVLLAWTTACSAVLPLGDGYTFGDDAGAEPDGNMPQADSGMPDSGTPDSAMPDSGEDSGTTDAGCDPAPTMEDVCADRCGTIERCGQSFSCGGCVGELSCGAATENVCGCESPPCAIETYTVGDAADQRLVAVAVDPDGNVFVAGHFRGTITLGGSTYTNPGTRDDIFLVKLAPNGSVLWSRAYAGTGDTEGAEDQQAAALAVDSNGNVILVGKSAGPVDLGDGDVNADNDIIIVKLDPNGGHVFSAAYGTEYSVQAHSVAVDPASQDIVLTGRFYGTLQFGSLSSMKAAEPGGYFDIFVVRFQPDGTPNRSRHFGDPNEQIPEAIASSGSHVYLSGYFTSDFDFGPPNTTTLSSSSLYSMFLTKLSTWNFAHVWSRQFGSEVSNTRLVTDTAGNLVVSGTFSGSLDITAPALSDADGQAFIAAIDSDGNTQWAKQLQNVAIDVLELGSDGTIYAAGEAFGDTDLGDGTVPYSGTRDAFVAHYAADGTHLWSRVFEAALGNQYGNGLAVAPDGTTWVGMEFEGQVDPGTGLLTTQGGKDLQVTRYVP